MNIARNKRYVTSTYTCRYTGVPFYYNTVDEREFMGLGSNMVKTNSWVAYTVKPDDTLDSIALKYYNNPTYWWVIAFFNDIQDPFVKLTSRYSILKLPSIGSIQFGAER